MPAARIHSSALEERLWSATQIMYAKYTWTATSGKGTTFSYRQYIGRSSEFSTSALPAKASSPSAHHRETTARSGQAEQRTRPPPVRTICHTFCISFANDIVAITVTPCGIVAKRKHVFSHFIHREGLLKYGIIHSVRFQKNISKEIIIDVVVRHTVIQQSRIEG